MGYYSLMASMFSGAQGSSSLPRGCLEFHIQTDYYILAKRHTPPEIEISYYDYRNGYQRCESV